MVQADRAQKALLEEEVGVPAVQKTLLVGMEYFVESWDMALEEDTCWDFLAALGCKGDTEQDLVLPEVTHLADKGTHRTVDFVAVDMAADSDLEQVDKASSPKRQRADKGSFLVLLDHTKVDRDTAIPYCSRDMAVET